VSRNSPPATTGRILVLDLGKYKTVACAHPGDPAGARVESLVTDREHLRKLFVKYRRAVVVRRACAHSGRVADLCEQLGLSCRVANTASEAWKFNHTMDALAVLPPFRLGRLMDGRFDARCLSALLSIS
jgi:hypothetical protein